MDQWQSLLLPGIFITVVLYSASFKVIYSGAVHNDHEIILMPYTNTTYMIGFLGL